MPATEPRLQASPERVLQLVEQAELAQDLAEFADQVLPNLSQIVGCDAAFLYVSDPRLPTPRFYGHGFETETASKIEDLCAQQFELMVDRAHLQVSTSALISQQIDTDLALYSLCDKDDCVGAIGLTADPATFPVSASLLNRVFRLLANIVGRLVERAKYERQLVHLNTYLTVSSMLSQSLDLHELLEIALYCCMEAVAAETASVLLLDDAKENLTFYQVEGPTQPVLKGATFPANKGLAGFVLQTQESEVINDVHRDPRFYGSIDNQSGFYTRNLIAIPLTAGEEHIGVLEVLNKVGDAPFTEEERLLLLSIAEEIAFAIRNAKMFEYVVSTYCKQRQGMTSCKGCERPLGSWTPCVKYRELGA